MLFLRTILKSSKKKHNPKSLWHKKQNTILKRQNLDQQVLKLTFAPYQYIYPHKLTNQNCIQASSILFKQTNLEIEVKKPTGRKPNVLNAVHTFMTNNALSFNYHFSHQVMADHIKERLEIGSPSTVGRVFKKKQLGWKIRKQRTVPYLTDENKAGRIIHCNQFQEAEDSASATTSFWRVHLDEKWFYLHPQGQLLYLPPGRSSCFESETQESHSKGHVPSCSGRTYRFL